MKRWAWLCIAIAIAGFATAQNSVDLAMVWRLKDEGLNRSEVMNTLSYLTDVYGARLTGSPNIRKAQEWAKDKLEGWGLANTHLEAYGPFGHGWTLERLSVEMLEPSYSPLIAFPKSWTPGTEGPVTGDCISVQIRSEEDFDRYRGKLQGRFVLALPARDQAPSMNPLGKRYSDEDLREIGQAPDPGRRPPQRRQDNPRFTRRLREFYESEGVVALLEPSPGDGGTVFVASGGPRTADSPVPRQLVVAAEHYNRILRILEKNLPVRLRVDIGVKFLENDLNAYNLIAEIPGTDRQSEIVMLGAHFDSHHAGTGATDNAAGSAVAMEAMRILRALDVRPRRTLRLALWTGEEQGLLGSAAYVADHFAARAPAPSASGASGPGQGDDNAARADAELRPLNLKPEYSKLSAYFNLDNGTGKIRGVYLQGNEEVRPLFSRWMEPFKDMGMTTLSIRNTGGTDHVSFDRVGLPGFQFIQDPIEYESRTHHSNMDLYDRLQRSDLMQASVIMAWFAWQAAEEDSLLPRKPMPRALQVVAGRE